MFSDLEALDEREKTKHPDDATYEANVERVLEYLLKNGLDLNTAVVGILGSAGGKMADLLIDAGVVNVLQSDLFLGQRNTAETEGNRVAGVDGANKPLWGVQVDVIIVACGCCYHADIFGLQLRAALDVVKEDGIVLITVHGTQLVAASLYLLEVVQSRCVTNLRRSMKTHSCSSCDERPSARMTWEVATICCLKHMYADHAPHMYALAMKTHNFSYED
jgi:hypothetical protein